LEWGVRDGVLPTAHQGTLFTPLQPRAKWSANE
jgi:hypothetical protein